jgi:hypothetical protein
MIIGGYPVRYVVRFGKQGYQMKIYGHKDPRQDTESVLLIHAINSGWLFLC